MYVIQTNKSGSRTLPISEQHLQTIEKYSLFEGLLDSNGIVDEPMLDKLKYTVRSLILAQDGKEEVKDLLDFCMDVLCHPNMKAYGLNELFRLYDKWVAEQLVPEI